MARSERGLKEGGENLERKVRKRAPSVEEVEVRSRRKGEGVGTGSGGRGKREVDQSLMGGDQRVFSGKNTSSSISRARGILCVFKLS